MREIKFRRWCGIENKMWYDGVIENDTLRQLDGDNDQIYLQFTGLKDINGKEIYEGDLIRFDYYHPTQGKIVFTEPVVFHQGTASYATEYLDGEFHYFGQHIFLSACELIGNIFETPELTGGG